MSVSRTLRFATGTHAFRSTLQNGCVAYVPVGQPAAPVRNDVQWHLAPNSRFRDGACGRLPNSCIQSRLRSPETRWRVETPRETANLMSPVDVSEAGDLVSKLATWTRKRRNSRREDRRIAQLQSNRFSKSYHASAFRRATLLELCAAHGADADVAKDLGPQHATNDRLACTRRKSSFLDACDDALSLIDSTPDRVTPKREARPLSAPDLPDLLTPKRRIVPLGPQFAISRRGLRPIA